MKCLDVRQQAHNSVAVQTLPGHFATKGSRFSRRRAWAAWHRGVASVANKKDVLGQQWSPWFQVRGTVGSITSHRLWKVSPRSFPESFVEELKARLHMGFLMRFRVQNAPDPTLHECFFREVSRGLERKLSHIIWRHPSFQFLLSWRYFVAALRD